MRVGHEADVVDPHVSALYRRVGLAGEKDWTESVGFGSARPVSLFFSFSFLIVSPFEFRFRILNSIPSLNFNP